MNSELLNKIGGQTLNLGLKSNIKIFYIKQNRNTKSQFYIIRAFNVCTDKYLENELNTIRDIAAENSFSTNIINKLIYEFRFRESIKKVNHKEIKYKSLSIFLTCTKY